MINAYVFKCEQIFVCFTIFANRNDLYLQISNGKVLQHRLVVAENEPTYIINIKRAIISQLQLPSFQDVDNDVIQVELLCS